MKLYAIIPFCAITLFSACVAPVESTDEPPTVDPSSITSGSAGGTNPCTASLSCTVNLNTYACAKSPTNGAPVCCSHGAVDANGYCQPTGSAPVCFLNTDCSTWWMSPNQCATVHCDPTGVDTDSRSPVRGCYVLSAADGGQCQIPGGGFGTCTSSLAPSCF